MICKAHPKYQGKRKPQVNCLTCWVIHTEQEHRKAFDEFFRAVLMSVDRRARGKKANNERRLDTPVHDG